MKQKIWSLIALSVLITVLAIPIGSSWLIPDSPTAAGLIWAAPGGPGHGPGGPGPGPGGPGHGPGHPQPPPPLRGMVVLAKGNFVMINLGKSDGVHPGMIFEVRHRIDTPAGIITRRVAKIKVDHIQSHSTRCIVIRWLAKKHKISHDDWVEEDRY